MSKIGFDQDKLAPYAKPGHFNDPDMLEIGNGGMSETEYRTHMSLWSILAAPLLAGNDLRQMSSGILEILTNAEVIAVNQDKQGKQGSRISKEGDREIWSRELAGGGLAVGLFNRSDEAAKMQVNWKQLGVKGSPHVRDLWLHKDVSASNEGYEATVPAHGVLLLRLAYN